MTSANILLQAENLSKKFADDYVVSDATFSLGQGEVLGLLGPNGAGKSTTVGMLYGAVIPTSGRATLCGFDVLTQGKRARKHLGVVPQGDNLDADLSVRGSLLAFCHYHNLSKAESETRITELLDRFHLTEHQRKNIDALSGGLKRRLALARALLSKPSIVFLDEPTTGLDPDARQEFWRDVIALRAQGRGVLLTTHYMEEAERLCDRIILLQNGKQVDQGRPEELILRHCGSEVIEIAGLEKEHLEALAGKYQTWCRRFADGFFIGLTDEALWHEVTSLLSGHNRKLRVARRAATLDDVFLLITGSSLS